MIELTTEPDGTFHLPIDKKHVIQSIVSVFETGDPDGDYGAVAVLPDGAGISYGKHQATDGGDNLDRILLRYIDLGGSARAEVQRLLPRLEEDTSTAYSSVVEGPVWLQDAAELLERLGHEDEVMQRAQDEIFDEEYWTPCRNHARAMQLTLPLSWAIVYDTCIHSGPRGVGRIRRRFPASPPSNGGDEVTWAKQYMQARRDWLASYGEEGHIVRRTVVRIDALMAIAKKGNWHLETPIAIGAPYRVTVR